MTASARRRRQLAVWWHVLTSVGWMSMTVVLLTMTLVARTTPGEAASAMTAAHRVDVALLAPLANASAATGVVLGLGTPWGLVVHRWVLAKLVITVVQINAGVFLLSPALNALTASARATPGRPGTGPSWTFVLGIALMAGAIALQAWLSIAKPGGPVRRRRADVSGRRPAPTTKPAGTPSWVLVAVVVGPMIDIVLGLELGYPTPILSLAVIVAAAVTRPRRVRHAPERRPRPSPQPPDPTPDPTPVEP